MLYLCSYPGSAWHSAPINHGGGCFQHSHGCSSLPVLHPRQKASSLHMLLHITTPPPTHTQLWHSNKKLLAMKLVFEEWRHKLEEAEHPFFVWIDHKTWHTAPLFADITRPGGMLACSWSSDHNQMCHCSPTHTCIQPPARPEGLPIF